MDVRVQSTQRNGGGRLLRKNLLVGGLTMWSGLTTGLWAADASLSLQPQIGNMQLTSTAFKAGEPIPVKHTCDGQDVSPPLNWTNLPPNTKSLALIADDPDAPMGTWVHWVAYDLPPTLTGLPENTPKNQSLPDGTKQGLNDFRRWGYGGPCPPAGKPHRYYFKLYALDTMLGLKSGATKKDVERAMDKHILGQAQLMGTYQRK